MNPRIRHRYGSCTVDSSLPLAVLPAATADEPDTFRIDLGQQACPDDTRWHHHWHDGDDVVLSLARQGSDYWLRFPDLADFLIQTRTGQVLLAPGAPEDESTIEHLLVDQLLPRLLAHRGQLILHASAVTLGGRHVLFLGQSGWGKSTLAGLLQGHGHTVHSDDCVQVRSAAGRYEALPTYPSLRLYPDSLDAVFPGMAGTVPVAAYSEKQRVALVQPAGTPQAVPMDALYVLGDPADAGDAVHISPLGPANTCQALIRHSFRLDLDDRDGNSAHFQRCAGLVRAVPAFLLDYRRDFRQSNALVEAIAQHLAGLPKRHPHSP